MSASDNVISKSSPIAKQPFYRLVIDASGEQDANAYSLNKALAEELLKLRQYKGPCRWKSAWWMC